MSLPLPPPLTSPHQNHLIGVTDDQAAKYLQEHNEQHGQRFRVNWFTPHVKIPDVQANTREANRVSSLKFSLLQTSLQLGYHTLITDMVGEGGGSPRSGKVANGNSQPAAWLGRGCGRGLNG